MSEDKEENKEEKNEKINDNIKIEEKILNNVNIEEKIDINVKMKENFEDKNVNELEKSKENNETKVDEYNIENEPLEKTMKLFEIVKKIGGGAEGSVYLGIILLY
jgi:hypothetical protein